MIDSALNTESNSQMQKATKKAKSLIIKKKKYCSFY
jgi:hypothetical protein